MVPDTVVAIIQQANPQPNGFQEPHWQLIGGVVENVLVKRRMAFESVRTQANVLQNVIDLTARRLDAVVDSLKTAVAYEMLLIQAMGVLPLQWGGHGDADATGFAIQNGGDLIERTA